MKNIHAKTKQISEQDKFLFAFLHDLRQTNLNYEDTIFYHSSWSNLRDTLYYNGLDEKKKYIEAQNYLNSRQRYDSDYNIHLQKLCVSKDSMKTLSPNSLFYIILKSHQIIQEKNLKLTERIAA